MPTAGIRNPQTRKLRFGIRSLIGGADNRLSTSKTLVMAWTVVVAWMLISEAIRSPGPSRNLVRRRVGALGDREPGSSALPVC